MSNYPQGAANDPQAPYNQRRRNYYDFWYIMVEGRPGNDFPHQYEVGFPQDCSQSEAEELARDWCRDNGHDFVSVESIDDPDYPVIITKSTYE